MLLLLLLLLLIFFNFYYYCISCSYTGYDQLFVSYAQGSVHITVVKCVISASLFLPCACLENIVYWFWISHTYDYYLCFVSFPNPQQNLFVG